MKKSNLLILKCFICFAILTITLINVMNISDPKNNFIVTMKVIKKTNIQEELNIANNSGKPPVKAAPPTTPQVSAPETKKKILIYNTHQSEQYSDGKSVVEGALALKDKLVALGYDVDVETNDFLAYAKKNAIGYEELYEVSAKFLKDNIANKTYDLIIDFHRDSAPRSATVHNSNNINYAKLMLVIGLQSDNQYEVSKMSSTLTDIINKSNNGIMRSTMSKYYTFNQDISNNMILVEVGSETNTFQEVLNSLDYLAKGIDTLLEE